MAVQLRALAETDVRQPIPSAQLLPALRAPPFVPVPGTFNTRDLGLLEGATAQDGSHSGNGPVVKIRPGFLYRSGSLDALRRHPAAQAAHLRDALGVRRIFDLRSRAERAAAPDPVIPGVEGVWVEPGEPGSVAGGEEEEEDDGRRKKKKAEGARRVVDLAAFVEGGGERGYVAMYMEVLAAYGRAFGEVLRSVRDRPGEGILFHCTGEF